MNAESGPIGTAPQTATAKCDLPEAYIAARAKLPRVPYRPTPVRRALARFERPGSADKRKLAAELRRLAREIERTS